jgi:hypothetical protein
MSERQISSKPIREYLDNEEIVLAIIRTATDIQQLLTEKLFFEKEIKFKLIENWTLERLIEWNSQYGLIDKSQVPLLNLFKRLRNIVFHRRTFMEKILQQEENKDIVKKIVLSVCNFIDLTKIEYSSTEEIEEEYSELINTIETKYANFLSDYYRLFSKPEERKNV